MQATPTETYPNAIYRQLSTQNLPIMLTIMPHDGFQTVFEISLKAFPWRLFAVCALFVVIGICLVRFSGGKQIRQVVGGFAVAFSLLMILLLGIRQIPDFVEKWRAYANGKYSVVEGPVEDFHPMPYEGHQNEWFKVRGNTFAYSSFDETPCFRSAASHGGPIRPGLNVRVYFTDGCILRLDVQR